MRLGSFEHYIEERVTILTESERVEGELFYVGGGRLSDFLNSPVQADARFLKIKNPTIYCRRSGQEICRVPFVMVARDRILMVMSHTSLDATNASLAGLSARPAGRSNLDGSHGPSL